MFAIELSSHPVERLFSPARSKVVGPAANDGIEFDNQPGLRTTAIMADKLFQVSQMAFLGLFAGPDQGFEIDRTLVRAGFVSPDPKLTDVEPEEVEPVGEVNDAGLVRGQGEASGV